MLTSEDILADMAKPQESGSCFVFDTLRLRANRYLQILNEDYNIFKEDEGYVEVHNPFTDSLIIGLTDRYLSYGNKARVTHAFDGSDEAIRDWTKDKIPFSDLETRTTQYITNTF